MKFGELKIQYKIPDRINRKLDDEIQKVVKKFGFIFIGSGYNFHTHIRDAVFEPKDCGD